MEEAEEQIQIQIPMDLNDTFGELNPSNLLNLDDEGADHSDADSSDPDNAISSSSSEEPRIGMEFESDEAAKEFYTNYAKSAGFSVRMNKSRRSRKDDTIIMRRFVCTKEGFHSKRVIYDDGKKKRKRGTAREGCMAMIEIVKKDSPSLSPVSNHSKWVVTKLVPQHTHLLPSLQSQSQPQINNINGESSSNYSKNNEMIACYNYNYNYNSRVIRVNPFGEGGEGQGLLEYLKRKQAHNPAFFYAVQVDNNNCMTNVFWADSQARFSYPYFRDAVTFDTSYKKTKYMMPFACFRGVNHHLQAVNLGCCLLMDETKGSYIWLFETWLTCMGGSHPLLLITDKDKAMEGAISRVFPNTRHRFCQANILSRCKHKLSDVYLKHATLKKDLKACVNGSGTVEEFTTRWEYLLQKYNLWDNTWLQSLYQIREKWANVCQRGFFFPNLFLSQNQQSLNKFFKRNFNAKTSLLVFIDCFDQDLASCHENESQADFESIHTKPCLKTPSLIEKQAADIYTRAVFDQFQEEFIQSFGYYVEKVEEDGKFTKYSLGREEEGENQSQFYVVCIMKPDNNRASCNCGKFEYSGILCRHILRVFFIIGVRNLPKEYILQRWTKNATSTSSTCLNERDGVLEEEQQSLSFNMIGWYNDLCRDGIIFGIGGGVSSEVYKIAKNALQKAFSDVLNEKNRQMKEQQQQQQNVSSRATRLQKMVKFSVPKLQPKKRTSQLTEDVAHESSSRT